MLVGIQSVKILMFRVRIFREFITKYYVELKKANPKFPILIRECSGVQPRVWARYGKSGKNLLIVLV